MIVLDKFKWILLIPMMLGCSSSRPVDLGNQIMMRTCKQIKKELDLNVFGTGYGGSPQGKLRALALTLTTDKKVNIEEARKILIYCCEKLLNDININEEIKPGLLQYPFTASNLDIMIGFEKALNKSVNPPYIALASALEGKVIYSTSDFDDEMFKVVHRESYDEALKICQEQCTFDSK